MKLIQAPEGEETNLDVAPMIDILFTLIIFFLATTTFQAQEREDEIQLPRHGGSSISSKDRDFIINVTSQGEYVVRAETVDLDHLRVLLKNAFQEKSDQKVLIRGDGDALWRHTTAVLDASTDAGFATAKIAMDTTQPD